jgi:hypothetical protein
LREYGGWVGTITQSAHAESTIPPADMGLSGDQFWSHPLNSSAR